MLDAGEGILWRRSAGTIFESLPLERDVVADVVVVGAGFTGLSAALHLAEAGVKVCVLEAAMVGQGGSGRNVGLVNAGLWTPPDTVEQTLGREAGERLNAALAAAPQTVFDLIERHGISCEATRQGTLHCAVGARGLADLQDRFEQQRKRQAPVALLDAEETAARIGSPAFTGSLLDRRAGTIQPFAYVQGLARAAQRAGAEIFEQSPAVAVRRRDGAWEVTTPKGRAVAKKLIQATNGYGDSDPFKNPFAPVHFFQVATRPLPPDLRRRILPGGEGCWDTATVMSAFRLDAAGRLIVGGVGNLGGLGGRPHRAWAQRKLRRLFPGLPALDFEHAWTGRIAMTGDHLPKIAGIGEDAVSIYGYSGRGIGPGTVFGKAAVGWVTNDDPEAFPVSITRPSPARLAGAKGLYYETGAVLFHLADAR